jgi:AmmeMemoRadiSam system protein A
MAHSHCMKLDKQARRLLLQLARDSLEHGLSHGCPFKPDLSALPTDLQTPAACFVTLHKDGQLRGCIGSLEPREPLATAVASSAYAAGFQDPRFPAIRAEELPRLSLDISILSPMQELTVASEQELRQRLRPGVDGVLLEEGMRHAVYLPAVWSQLPNPRVFIEQLKLKGGWPANYWSDTLKVRIFQSLGIEQPAD